MEIEKFRVAGVCNRPRNRNSINADGKAARRSYGVFRIDVCSRYRLWRDWRQSKVYPRLDGWGPILCVFGPALLMYFRILPAGLKDIVKNFVDNINFFAFFISIMIAGGDPILSRKIIIKSTLKFLPAILGGLLMSCLLAFLVGAVTGYGGKNALFNLAIPIMGGGVGSWCAAAF